MNFETLALRARQLVAILERLEPDLTCIVILSTPALPGTDNRARYACETNVARGSDVARVCREVAQAIQVS